MSKFLYKISKKSDRSDARLGIISTPHGVINTPAFVTVATNAVVKGGVSVDDIAQIKGQALLGNTYHLMVRDKVSVIKRAGGLGKFMNWTGPTFTDSGGFQVFSLGQRLEDGVGKFANYDSHLNEHGVALSPEFSGSKGDKSEKDKIRKLRKKLVTINEEGVKFNSHIDGRLITLTPEKAIKIQNDIGADIFFTFDEPTSPIATKKYTKISMDRTHRWAERSLKSHRRKDQALFGIIQGGPFEDLRRESAKFIASLDFPGFGIGGSYHRIKGLKKFKELEAVVPMLPKDKPRHFLGIGGIEDMLIAVKQGMDTFDCVMPTREARHGRLYVRVRPGFNKGFYKVLNITNAKFKNDLKSVNNSSLKNYGRSYLNHLFKTQEMLGVRLATINNLEFYFDLMADIRNAIKEGKF